MKTLRKTLMTLLALSCLHANAQVSLDECIKSAFDNYPQIEEMDLIKASEGYDLKNAAMAWLPQLSISAKASWQSDVVEMPFSIPGMEIKIPHDQYGITADLTQQIWDGGAAASKSKRIKAGAEVKRKQLEVNLYSIKSKVQSIYLGIILLDKQIEFNDVLETNLRRNLEEVKASAEGGVAGKSDIDQIRVNLLSCEQQKAGLMEDRKAYVRMLGLLTGKDLTGQTLAEPQLKADSSMDIKRPELALYDAQALQTQAQEEQLNTSLWPRLNLNLQAGYGRPGLNMLSGEFDPYFIAGLKMQWNIGSFYTLKNDRRKSEAENQRIDATRRSFLLNTSVEAAQKRSQVTKDMDVIARDEEIIELRKSIRETAEQQYKEGVIKMNDYLSLLDEEFKARLNQNVHEVQYMMDLLDLNNTLGI